MTGREQFEAWIKSETGFDLWRTNYPMTKPEDQQYKDHSTNLAWMAWQASREAVEVELPEPHAHVIWVQAGNAPDDYWDDVEISRSEQDKCCDGSDRYPVYARHEVVSMLDSAGIKVKGE